jgi:hypothetical protein
MPPARRCFRTKGVTTPALAPRARADTNAGLATVDDVCLATRQEREWRDFTRAPFRCWLPCLPRWLSHKPSWGEFSCARVTTPRVLRRSNQSGDVLDGRDIALHVIGQIGDCAPIQLPVVYATTTAHCRDDATVGRDARVAGKAGELEGSGSRPCSRTS